MYFLGSVIIETSTATNSFRKIEGETQYLFVFLTLSHWHIYTKNSFPKTDAKTPRHGGNLTKIFGMIEDNIWEEIKEISSNYSNATRDSHPKM